MLCFSLFMCNLIQPLNGNFFCYVHTAVERHAERLKKKSTEQG
jgi:hypothetical protein